MQQALDRIESVVLDRRGLGGEDDIAPQGVAYVGTEDWTAVSEGAAIPRGSKVRVKRVEGMRLIVEPAPAGAEARGGS